MSKYKAEANQQLRTNATFGNTRITSQQVYINMVTNIHSAMKSLIKTSLH